MYEIKSINETKINYDYFLENSNELKLNTNNNNKNHQINLLNSPAPTPPSTLKNLQSPAEQNPIMLMLRRRRIFQRNACLISIMIAFILGLILGVLMPMISIQANYLSKNLFNQQEQLQTLNNKTRNLLLMKTEFHKSNNNNNNPKHHPDISEFPTIYEIQHHQLSSSDKDTISVSFINNSNDDGTLNNNNNNNNNNEKLPVEEVFRNAFHLQENSDNTMLVKKLDSVDGSIKEFRVERTSDGMYRKGPERRISKPSVIEQVLSAPSNDAESDSVHFVAMHDVNHHRSDDIIQNGIYWGDAVEQLIPKGFNKNDASDWNQYVHKNAIVTHLENGCGRMQNRLVIFKDGTRACARYRQNTDQIQGELFSFYLGQLLNLTNLAPSAVSVIDLETDTWSKAASDIQQSQWKSNRPVVLTKWLANLEPANIPLAFQPLERHLNKFDVWNITLGMNKNEIMKRTSNNKHETRQFINEAKVEKGRLLERLGAATGSLDNQSAESNQSAKLNDTDRLNRLIELAQWSDLIVFDYLIANLDRVVNNLYNYQWNSDIMAAPAHNLAKQSNSQLLVFLDNESGLLHGYRLLKKYEAYHGLLLDNLCVFRRPTIDALRELRKNGPGELLHQLFENTTSHQIRDVLPSLPDKSIKILIDRIDLVLGQVQKCRDLFSDR